MAKWREFVKGIQEFRPGLHSICNHVVNIFEHFSPQIPAIL